MTATNTIFATYMTRLMADLGLTDFQAAAILGNAAYESNGFQTLVEGNGNWQDPNVGIGWLQWTGVRHTDYLNYCSSRGLNWQADESNYSYIVYEVLNDNYWSSGASLADFKVTPKNIDCTTGQEYKNWNNAVWYFEQLYERPAAASSSLIDRYTYALTALNVYHGVTTPDLDIRDADPTTAAAYLPSLSTSSVTSGDFVTLTYRLSNWGPSAASSSITGIYLSTDAVFDGSDRLLTTDPVSSLASGVGVTRSITFSTSGVSAGAYYIFAVADCSNTIYEVNEANNACSGLPLTVVGGTANHAPVVTAQNVTVGAGQSIAASSMIASVTDADGDTIAQYGFWDGVSGGGYFTVNGVVQSAGQWIDVAAANLSSVRYWGGSAAGSETIYVDAYDSKDWSTNASLTATTTATANHAPVVAAQNVSVGAGQSIAASSMISSVTDADGDTIAQYGFWDGGSGGGYFTVNGVVQSAGQWIDVAAANLSSVSIGAARGQRDNLCGRLRREGLVRKRLAHRNYYCSIKSA